MFTGIKGVLRFACSSVCDAHGADADVFPCAIIDAGRGHTCCLKPRAVCCSYVVTMSYIQIYMELIQDLLRPDSENLVSRGEQLVSCCAAGTEGQRSVGSRGRMGISSRRTSLCSIRVGQRSAKCSVQLCNS